MIENNFLVSVETVNRLRRYSNNTLRASNYKGQRRPVNNGISKFSLQNTVNTKMKKIKH